MKIIFNWDSKCAQDTIVVHSQPQNQATVESAFKKLTFDQSIQVRDARTDRLQNISLTAIESFTAFGYLAKVATIDGNDYYYPSNLKQLAPFSQNSFLRINNTTILNLQQVANFAVGSNARLVVYTQSGRRYIVSRYYARQIREWLK